MNPFFEKLERRWEAGGRVCIGLDPDASRLPVSLSPYPEVFRAVEFNKRIIKETHDIALAYKPNIAFYPGPDGLRALIQTVEFIRAHAPDMPVILDAKRADIGNTNRGYVREAFKEIQADAVTVNPYLGEEALRPFLEREDKGIIVLCRTSNPGADEYQDLEVRVPEDGATMVRPLYEQVASNVARKWNSRGNCALVVGATAPEQLARVRRIVGDLPILIPGVGAQGGDLEAAVTNGVNSRRRGIIINSSSGIIFASSGGDFAEAAKLAAQKLTGEIEAVLPKH